jgi:hypothetical protein
MERPSYTCHLVDLSCMVGTQFSLTLASLHGSALVDEEVRRSVRIERHVHSQAKQIPDDIAATLDLGGNVMVAFTVYFWNRGAALAVARRVKDRNPDAVIVFGGNDVSHQGDRLLMDHLEVDIVVNGEGELTFRELLAAWCQGTPFGEVAGLTFREEALVRTTDARPRVSDLGSLPSPFLSEIVPAEEVASSRTIVFELGRGCPFACAFCYWGGAINTRVRWYPIDRIRAELDFLIEHMAPGSTLFLADANFGMAATDIDVARALVDLTRKYDKEIFLFANWAKSQSNRIFETARVLFEGNLIASVTLSAQSLSTETLELVNRRNIPWSHYEELQQRFSAQGIPTYTELILGLPGETRESYLDGISRVLSIGGHPVVYPLLLLNNTELASAESRAEHEFDVQSLPYQLSDPMQGVDTVVGTACLSVDEWVDLLSLNLALAVCHHVMARRIVRLCADRIGWRETVELLGGVFDGPGSMQEFHEIYRNHTVTLLEPELFDADLITQWTGTDCTPDHVHFQALCRLGLRRPDRFLEGVTKAIEPRVGPLPEELLRVSRSELVRLGELEAAQPHFDATLLALYHGSLDLHKIQQSADVST